MSDYLKTINEFSTELQKACVWHNSGEVLAPVLKKEEEGKGCNYIYEFYCYLRVIADLKHNYTIKFVEGEKKFKYKFPQAAADKKGKPRFDIYDGVKREYQVCAGTKINCDFDTEDNHPDISFQKSDASDEPTKEDLVFIMDAKYQENINSNLSKDEVYKFNTIMDLFDLKRKPHSIKFSTLKNITKSCLITNANGYSDASNTKFIQSIGIQEVECFRDGVNFNVLG